MIKEYEGLIDGLLNKGYGLVDGFLDPLVVDNLSNNIIAKRTEGSLKKAGIGKLEHFTVDKTVRGDYIQWITQATTNGWEKIFMESVGELVAYLNRTCFTAINGWEFHYALYPRGTFYKKHFDRFRNDDRRKYTLICYLNNDWVPEDGGQLIMHFPERKVEILPTAGRVVFFEADKVLHEVLPARRERMSITGWLKV